MIKKQLLIFIIALLPLVAACGKSATRSKNILFTDSRVEAARQRMTKDSSMQLGWVKIMAVADQQLEKHDVMKADYVTLAWLMTGEQRYADCLKKILRETVKRKWTNDEMMARKPEWRSELRMAVVCFQTAVAYSAVREILTEKERKSISADLLRLLVEPSLGDWLIEPTRIHSLNSMGHNWWTACVYEGALLAMAIQDDQPQCREWVKAAADAMPLWFAFEGDVLQNKPRTFDRNGGMYESINYASFGISEALKFMIAYKDKTPDTQLHKIPQLGQIADFFVHTAYPRTGQLYTTNFGDGHIYAAGELPLCLLWTLGYQDRNILWYTSQVEHHQHHEGCFVDEPIGFIFRPDLSAAPKVPRISTQQIFPDFGWATMRTSWEKDATMLAVKSGHTWNHNHADNNSFILFHHGSPIIKDCGNCSYGKREYRDFFFQSDAHNIIKIDGEGQLSYQQYHGGMIDGSLHDLIADNGIRYVLGNATGTMSDKVSRWFRHWLWIDDVIYVVDDVHAHRQSQFEWLWHYSGKARRNGGRLDITDGDAAISIIPLFPQPMAPSDYVHDYPEYLRWDVRKAPTEDLSGEEEYYALILPGKTDYVKAVNAIVLKDKANDRNLPRIERMEGKDWIGMRVTYKGRVTDLYINQLADGRLMHQNSWIECDGWTTDAYMLAFSYAEGQHAASSAAKMFVCYGSAVRRDGKSWYSSLIKKTFIK